MPIATSKSCATCQKPCYPTEKVSISDLWVHKQGCLKCSVCFTTLSLSSVYIAPSPLPPNERQLFCAKDVPKVVHTTVVDSLALRAAMNAPKSTITPPGTFAPVKNKGSTKSIRFKGLTLRSRAIKAGLEAPKLNLRGLMKQTTIVGTVPGSPLDSWDIVHALNAQSQVSSPIQDHPAIHAQRTGSSASIFPMPSQPLMPDLTGEKASELAKAGKDEEALTVEPDLVKNLIKVFQLSTVDNVEVTPPSDPLTTSGFADIPNDVFNGGSLKPSSTEMQLTVGTIKTLGTLGSRLGVNVNGTDTMFSTARSHNTPIRPALSDLFLVGPQTPEVRVETVEVEGYDDVDVTPKRPGLQSELSFSITPTPVPSPAANSIKLAEDPMSMDESTKVSYPTLEEGRRAMELLHSLLPFAAHMIPLPQVDVAEVDDLDEPTAQALPSLPSKGSSRSVASTVLFKESELELAREELARDLEDENLELVMLFEEEPESVWIAEVD